MWPSGGKGLSETICPWPEGPPGEQPEAGTLAGGGMVLTHLLLSYSFPANPIPTLPNPESKRVISRKEESSFSKNSVKPWMTERVALRLLKPHITQQSSPAPEVTSQLGTLGIQSPG